MLYTILDNQNITIEKKDQILESTINSINNVYSKLEFSFDDINTYDNKIKSILHFIDLIILKEDIDNIKLLSIIETFIKKISKNEISNDKINERIYNTNFDTVLKTYNTNKIVSWFF